MNYKILSICVLMGSFVLTSCGNSGKQFVTDVDVQTVNQDQQKWLVSNFRVNLGKVELPELVYPLPSDYGNFRSYRKDAANYLGVDFNISSILNLPGNIATLPNGQVVPIDVGGAGIIEIPIDKINGKVYLAVADGVALIGVATVIKQLSDLDVGDIGVFPTYKVGKVDVMAGVFTSKRDNTNGIAIFANLAGIWDGNQKEYDSDTFIFEPEYVRKSKQRKVYRKLRKLLRQKMQIEFQRM